MVFYQSFMWPILSKQSNPVLELKYRIQKVSLFDEGTNNHKEKLSEKDHKKSSSIKKIINKYNRIPDSNDIAIMQKKLLLLSKSKHISPLRNAVKTGISPIKQSQNNYRKSISIVHGLKLQNEPNSQHRLGSVATMATEASSKIIHSQNPSVAPMSIIDERDSKDSKDHIEQNKIIITKDYNKKSSFYHIVKSGLINDDGSDTICLTTHSKRDVNSFRKSVASIGALC